MKKLLNRFSSLRRAHRPKPAEVQKAGQWHPLFYKAVKLHLMETSSKNGNWA